MVTKTNAFEFPVSGGSSDPPTIQAGAWKAINDYAPSNELACFNYYETAMGRPFSLWRSRGEFGRFSAPIFMDYSITRQIAEKGAIISTKLDPQTGTGGGRVAVPYQQVLDGDWDTDASAEASTGRSLTSWGNDLKRLQDDVPGSIVLMELHHEANYGSGTSGAQPGTPDGPNDTVEGGGGNTAANRQRFADWFMYIRDFWEGMGINNILYALTMAGQSTWTAGGQYTRWYNEYLDKSYVDVIAQDAYSWAKTGTAQGVELCCLNVAVRARALGKPCMMVEIGCEPGAGTGTTIQGITYNNKADYFRQMRAHMKAYRDVWFAFCYNLSDETDNMFEPETYRNIGVPGPAPYTSNPDRGITSPSWGTFMDMMEDPDFAVGPPLVLPDSYAGGGGGTTSVPDGTQLTIANSSYTDNDAADHIEGTITVYTDTISAGGGRFARAEVDAASSNTDPVSYWEWSQDNDDAFLDVVMRMVNPPEPIVIAEMIGRRDKVLARVIMNQDGTMELRNRKNEVVDSGIDPTPSGAWFRLTLEMHLDATTPANNSLVLSTYYPTGSALPWDTLTDLGGDVGVLGRTIKGARFGILSPVQSETEIDFEIASLTDAAPPSPPTITDLDPTTVTIGQEITITGTGFTGVATVRFGNTIAPDFVVESSTVITVNVPVGTVSGVTVSVQTPNGTAESSETITIGTVTTGDLAFVDVTPSPGHSDLNATSYVIPARQYVSGKLYVYDIESYGTPAALRPIPTDSTALVWDFVDEIIVGTNAVARWRCIPTATVTEAITVGFSPATQHLGLSWQCFEGTFFEGGANGANAFVQTLTDDSAGASQGSASIAIPGYVTGADHAWLATLQTNAVGSAASTEGTKLHEDGYFASPPNTAPRTAISAYDVGDDTTAGFTSFPSGVWRAIVSEIAPGAGGGGGGSGGGGSALLAGPHPNTDPNPTPDVTHSITGLTMAQVQALLDAQPTNAKIKLTGHATWTSGGGLRPKTGQQIFGNQGSPTILENTGTASRAFDLKNAMSGNGASNVMISDIEIDNFNDRGIALWRGAFIRRCDIHDCMIAGLVSSAQITLSQQNEANMGIIIDTCNLYNNGLRNPDQIGHTTGGIKISYTGDPGNEDDPIGGSSLILRNCRVYNNLGVGLWCDLGCAGIRWEYNLIYDNCLAGIYFEICAEGSIYKNILYGNGRPNMRDQGGNLCPRAGTRGQIQTFSSAYCDMDENIIMWGLPSGLSTPSATWPYKRSGFTADTPAANTNQWAIQCIETDRSDVPGGNAYAADTYGGVLYPQVARPHWGYAIYLNRIRHNMDWNLNAIPLANIQTLIRNIPALGTIEVDRTLV